jgi:hypothetical protein
MMAKYDEYLSGEVTRAFGDTMTIENYVRLRRQYPKATLDVRMSETIEFAYADHGLEDFEISHDLLAEALTGNRAAISELSLVLLEHIVARDRAERHGATHLASRGLVMGDGMVNQIVNRMIDGLIDADNPRLPSDLVILIRHQTGGVQSEWEKERKAQERESAALFLALELAMKGEAPTARRLGQALGVNPSTVVRWFQKGALENFKKLAQMAAHGSVKQVDPTFEDELASGAAEVEEKDDA